MDALTWYIVFNMKLLLHHANILVMLTQDASLCLCDFRREEEAERASHLNSRVQRGEQGQ